jgi:hypothetical protein
MEHDGFEVYLLKIANVLLKKTFDFIVNLESHFEYLTSMIHFGDEYGLRSLIRKRFRIC